MLCPGFGQLVQRRWIAGTLYLLAFIALFISVIAVVLQMTSTNIDAALAFMNNEPNKDFASGPESTILRILGLSLLVYLASIIDTYAAFRRAIQRSTAEQLKLQ
jgi:hypothetical protein